MSAFFRAIWPTDPDLWGELRAIKGGRVVQEYFPLVQDASEHITVRATELTDAGFDTYYGVLPRTRREGTSDACTMSTRVLWADVDAKHFSTNLATGKRFALERITSISLPPQVLVDSGGGYHAYWLLRDPTDYLLARDVMTGLARRTGGDAVYDQARVLRIPGTRNWKRSPETYSRLIRFDANRGYSASDFDAYTFEKDFAPRRTGPMPRLEELPEWLTDLILHGAPVGLRSEATFKACIYLLKYGRTPAEVRSFIRNTPDGIGAKYAEMNAVSAERWLDRTIEKASERL